MKFSPELLNQLILVLPGMVRMRRKSTDGSQPKEAVEMRFNWYDFGKSILGYLLAAGVALLTATVRLEAKIESVMKINEARFESLTAINNEIRNGMELRIEDLSSRVRVLSEQMQSLEKVVLVEQTRNEANHERVLH
jgi:hypothetical protein